jgi:hypothetical protein
VPCVKISAARVDDGVSFPFGGVLELEPAMGAGIFAFDQLFCAAGTKRCSSSGLAGQVLCRNGLNDGLDLFPLSPCDMMEFFRLSVSILNDESGSSQFDFFTVRKENAGYRIPIPIVIGGRDMEDAFAREHEQGAFQVEDKPSREELFSERYWRASRRYEKYSFAVRQERLQE